MATKRKRTKLSGRRLTAVRQQRRETIYRMEKKRHYGKVPCFCCGAHVELCDATLEHRVPLSKGGTDDMNNLAISHGACNHARGNA